jgi:hypothetical protein
MKAVQVAEFGAPSVLETVDQPLPEPQPALLRLEEAARAHELLETRKSMEKIILLPVEEPAE